VNRWLEEAQLRGQFEEAQEKKRFKVAHTKRLDNKMYNNSKMKRINGFYNDFFSLQF
jgi:hypothetical protein